MIDAAEAVGVKRFVLGEFANAPDQKRLPDLEFARKSKKEVLKYAMERAAANAAFTWSALAVGSFIDWVSKASDRRRGGGKARTDSSSDDEYLTLNPNQGHIEVPRHGLHHPQPNRASL